VGSSYAWEISRLHTVSIHGERTKVNFGVCGDYGVKLKGKLAGSVPTKCEDRFQYDKRQSGMHIMVKVWLYRV